jgi:GNAT superfamily N-acetyltransferase
MGVSALLEFRDLSWAEIEPAARLLAHGMRDNPIVAKAFGSDHERRERRLVPYYRQVVRMMLPKGGFLGGYIGPKLVGVVGTFRPGCCQPGLVDVVRFVPTLLAYNSILAALRVKRWQDVWSRHDPSEHHWHVGLVAVDSNWQGRGVGTQIMSEHCTRMDSLAATSYLETDKAINVRFYQKLGYQIMADAPVLGTTNWFMKRVASRQSPVTSIEKKPQSLTAKV